MAEYIDREKIFGVWRRIPAPASEVSLAAAIHQTPAEDVAPVVHGNWIRIDTDGEAISKCSVCKFPVSTFWNESNYCPNCGAKMDGGKDNG